MLAFQFLWEEIFNWINRLPPFLSMNTFKKVLWSEVWTSFLLFGRWAESSCAMDTLYDMDLISETVPVILDNSKDWFRVLSTSMRLGARGVAHVEGISRVDVKENSHYSNLLLINRTASPLSWYWMQLYFWLSHVFFSLNVSKEKELFENWVVVIVGRKIGIFVWIIV